MNEGTPIDDHLLAKYIAGEADATERTVVEQWADASDANAQELERMRSLWNWSGDGSGAVDVDEDAAWARVNTRIEEAGSGVRVISLRTWNLRRWVAAAAVVAGVVLAARFWMQPKEEVFFAAAEYTPVKLADSSDVMLSPLSNIRARIDDERAVELNGEAYFEVKRDTQRPFVIDAGDVEVTVLGTAFTVDAFDTAQWVLVRVREGRVQVKAGGRTVVIGALQHAGYDRKANRLDSVSAPRFEVWGERIIHFEDAPLIQVIIELEKIFPVSIHLANEDIVHCRLTATFEDEPIDRILNVIAETYGLTLTEPVADRYQFDGDGCK